MGNTNKPAINKWMVWGAANRQTALECYEDTYKFTLLTSARKARTPSWMKVKLR